MPVLKDSITLNPPAEGSVINLPLGQSKAVIFSGDFQADTENYSVDIRVSANGESIAATMDASNGSFQASVTVTSPSEVSVRGTMNVRLWVEPVNGKTQGHWKEIETITSDVVGVSVRSAPDDTEYLLTCRCLSAENRPIVALQAEAYNQSPQGSEDKLGATALTGADGTASFSFRSSNFTPHPGQSNPDVYFKFSLAGVARSYTLPNAQNDNGVLRNFAPSSAPVVAQIVGVQGYIVQGAILAKWLSLGASTGFLGLPITDETATPDGRGRFNHFENGSIYWTPEFGAFEVHGGIKLKWAALNWEKGLLGYPITDETGTPDGRGRFNHFEHGSIYWTPEHGAFEVHGDIKLKWTALNSEQGVLGYPVTDETATPDGRGRFNHFESGSIYWTPEWGASEVHGLNHATWSAIGWETSFLGYPVSDQLVTPDGTGGLYNVFEHGLVIWRPGLPQALAQQHDYKRIYGAIRAQILARFFAIGIKGRRNHFASWNQLATDINPNPQTPAERQEAEKGRWRMVENDDANPFLSGAGLHIALAVEQEAGNEESARALEAALNTWISLCRWQEAGAEASARLPMRYDAGIPISGLSADGLFLGDGNNGYVDSLPSSDISHYFRRDQTLLEKMIGPSAAQEYIDSQSKYWNQYRSCELSMDELIGLVTACWAIAKLSQTPQLTGQVRQISSFIGNYLADNAYILARPMLGLAYQGSTGALPAMEFPISRALGSITGENYSARTDFRGAMMKAGYWDLIEQAVTEGQTAGVVTSVLIPLFMPVLIPLGWSAGLIEELVAKQSLTPAMLGAAASLVGLDAFDISVSEIGEPALALLLNAAADKAALFRTVTLAVAAVASYRAWFVNFNGWLGLTGLDDTDSTVRDTFEGWFQLRQSQPAEKEAKGQGSRNIFTAGVKAILASDADSEKLLVDRIEQGIVGLFRNCYFDPQLPVIFNNSGGKSEALEFYHWSYEGDPGLPYGPMDLLSGMAMAFWHAKRRSQAGTPVSTARFPTPLTADDMTTWPLATVPEYCLSVLQEMNIPMESIQGTSNPVAGAGGYALFGPSAVPRQPKPSTAPHWPPATALMCDITVPVKATDGGDVPTGITLQPGCEFQIDATGSAWCGAIGVASFGPDGDISAKPNDLEWPVHSAIDPAARKYCLVGRLNGYFSIGSKRVRTQWTYPEPRRLFLRINDNQPGDGSGQFDVRIQVWAPPNTVPSTVFQPVNVLRDGGVLRTSEASDLIEVTVLPNAAPGDQVQFVLNTPDKITWRKEIVIREGPTAGTGTWTVWTQDGTHSGDNGLYLYQLPGASLTFRKDKSVTGMHDVAVLNGLEIIPGGTQVAFNWVHD